MSAPRNRARLVHVTEAELRTELDALLEQVKDCHVGPECPCHLDAWDRIDRNRFLFGDKEQP